MEPKQSLPGPGYFQWNRGGWFGSQFGSTVWMVVGAIGLAPHAPEITIPWLACFAATNGLGTWLWRRRDRLQPYPAMQVLLLACGVAGLIALAALHLLRPGLRISRLRGIPFADETIALPLIVALLLMAYFHLLERSAKRNPRSQG